MPRKRATLTLIAVMAFFGACMAQNYFDDIYFNPKKEKTPEKKLTGTSTAIKQPTVETNYIADMASMDVDTYNRRGQYYASSIDTIGTTAENGEDFVYTQQIQKYYNPTIVVENANNLGDILTNAYGNVDIVINDNGYPIFAPYYGWNWPYYSSVWGPSWYWGWNIGSWGWNIGWYDPWFSWNWGWGPGWWNPLPPPRPGWGPGPGWGRPGPMATWSPGGNRPIGGPRPGVGNQRSEPNRGMVSANRPMSSGRPGNQGLGSRPPVNNGKNRPSGVINNDGRWQYNNQNSGRPGSTVNPSAPGNTGSHGTYQRPSTVISNGNSNVGNQRPSTGTKPSVSTPNNNSTSRPSINNNPTGGGNRSTGIGRSTGGGNRSTGGGSRGGGGGRHR